LTELSDVAGWVSTFSYPAVVLLLFGCGLGLPLSEDVILLTAGIVSARGGASLTGMIVASYVGILLGDSTLFRIGKTLGPRATQQRWIARVLTEKRVAWVRSHFQRHGLLTLFLARYLPGFRAPAYLIAGMSGMPYGKFILADGAAALVSVPIVVTLGHRFGHAALKDIEKTGVVLLIALGIALVVGFALKRFKSRKPAEVPKVAAAARDAHDAV